MQVDFYEPFSGFSLTNQAWQTDKKAAQWAGKKSNRKDKLLILRDELGLELKINVKILL